MEPGWSNPNPLDRLFLAIDEAWRRQGLPGAEIQLRLELTGAIHLDALRRARRAAGRTYPAIDARLAPRGVRRALSWRLGMDADEAAIRIVDVTTLSDNERRARVDSLLAERRDVTREAPFRLDLFRGAPHGDLLVARWPHALMDARGGVTILEEIAQFAESGADWRATQSRGDEQRSDFGALDPRATLPGLWRGLTSPGGAARPRAWRELRLCPPRAEGDPGRLGAVVRRLDVREAAAARDAALRVCGFARLGDYVRACVVCAMREVTPPSGAPGEGYSTVQLVDNRRRRDAGPVCHNVFSALPVYVPAAIAGDVKAVADHIMDSTTALLSTGVMQARLSGLAWLTQLATPTLAGMIQRKMLGKRGLLPMGVAAAPSVPMGFMGPFSRPTPRFCGAVLRNIYGVRTPAPGAGFSLTVNTAQERMNLAAAYYDGRVAPEVIERLLDLSVMRMLG